MGKLFTVLFSNPWVRQEGLVTGDDDSCLHKSLSSTHCCHSFQDFSADTNVNAGGRDERLLESRYAIYNRCCKSLRAFYMIQIY